MRHCRCDAILTLRFSLVLVLVKAIYSGTPSGGYTKWSHALKGRITLGSQLVARLIFPW